MCTMARSGKTWTSWEHRMPGWHLEHPYTARSMSYKSLSYMPNSYKSFSRALRRWGIGRIGNSNIYSVYKTVQMLSEISIVKDWISKYFLPDKGVVLGCKQMFSCFERWYCTMFLLNKTCYEKTIIYIILCSLYLKEISSYHYSKCRCAWSPK